MPNQPHDIRTTPVTSAKGRSWLASSVPAESSKPQVAIVRNTSAGPIPNVHRIQTSGNSPQPSRQPKRMGPIKRTEVRVTSVEIPDVTLTKENCQAAVAQLNGKPAECVKTLSDPKQIAMQLAEASDQRLEELAAQLDNRSTPLPSLEADESASTPPMVGSTIDSTDEWIGSPPSSFAAAEKEEPSESWSTQSDPTKSRPQETPTAPMPESPPAPQATAIESAASLDMGYQPIPREMLDQSIDVNSQENQTDFSDDPLTGVIESILAKRLPKQATALMFAGSDGNPLVDSTAANVCSLLTRQRLGRVLLIDANQPSQQLSVSSGTHGKAGMAEIILEGSDWRELVRSGAASGVDFLSIGNRTIDSNRFQPRLRELMSELKTEYDFVCISVGDSDSNNAKRWSELCDGCYLLISQKNDNPSIARAAITELQTSGARLLGCVVTDTQG